MSVDPGAARATAERRRVIDRALDQRPDLEVADLLRILDRLGVGVEEAVLREDLDALGFDVLDERAGATAATGSTTRDAYADPPPPRRRTPAPDDPVVAALAAEDRPVSGRGRSDLPLVAIAGVVLAVLVVAVLVLGRGDDDAAVEPGDVLVEESTTEPGLTITTTTAPGTPAPPPPASDPALGEPDVLLDFGVDGGRLPEPAPGVGWTALAGDFEVVGGQAVSTPPGDGGAVATFPTAAPDLRAQVTLPEGSDGAGLVFGLDDAGYDAWVVDAAAGRADLLRVTASGRELVTSSDAIAVVPGTTLGIHLADGTAELLANGVVVGTVPLESESRALGLAALEPGTRGVFDDLLVQYT